MSFTIIPKGVKISNRNNAENLFMRLHSANRGHLDSIYYTIISIEMVNCCPTFHVNESIYVRSR